MTNTQNTTLTASAFLSGLGVDTHIAYTDGGYVNISNVLSDLKYLGINQVRDGISNGENGSAPLSSYITLAKAGIHFTFVIESQTTDTLNATLALIEQVQQAAPGSVVAIEGPNEINNQPITFNGVSGLQGALNLQAAIYSVVHSDAKLAGVSVDYFTGYDAGGVALGPDPGTTPGLADYDTQHPYPNFGQAPAAWVSRSMALPNTVSSTTPAVYTETGYSTSQVDPTVQAKYELDLLMDTASQNISKTYLYELMDAYAPGSPQGDGGWGLFDYTKAAKPTADALHNATAILQDNGAASSTFQPTPLAYTLTGLPTTGNSLTIEKSDGSYVVAIWAEPQIWNTNSNSRVVAPTEQVTLRLPTGYASAEVFDPLSGSSPVATYNGVNTVTIALTDHPIFIELKNPTTVAAPTVAITSQILAHDTGVSASDNITSNGLVSLTGQVTGAAGTKVQIDDGATVLGAATLDGNGGWSFSTTLGAGGHSLHAVATDPTGQSVSSAAQPTITVETAPVLTIGTPVQAANSTTVTLSGAVTSTPGVTVEIHNGAADLGPATVANGTWTYTGALSPGGYNFTATATDPAGNTTTTSDPQFVVAPVSVTTPVSSGSDTLVLSLSETPKNGVDAQFTVSVDGHQIGGVQSVSALRSAGQAQDLLLQGNFGVGAHTVSVNFVNGFSGNMADADRALYINAITLDGNTTFENTSDRFAGAVNYSLTTPTTPTASKAGTQDTLVLNLSETQMGGADAQFMVSVDGQIVGGVHTVTAQHSASQTQDITLTGNFGSGSHAVTIDFLNGFAGNQADAGRTLYVNAITLDGKTTTENSTQSYVGAQTYAVQSGATTGLPRTVAAPTLGSVSQILAHDTGVSASDNITSNGLVSLTGQVTGAAGTKVQIDDGATVLGAATLDGNGGWSFSTTLGAGGHSLHAVATDPTGQSVSSAAQPTITVETAPVLTIGTPVQAANSTTVTLSGAVTSTPGVTVEIHNGAADLGPATVANGTWTYTGALSPGGYNFTATATDPAGNTTTTSDPQFVVAPVSVTTPVSSGSDTLVLSLSETPKNGVDAQFTVSVDGHQIGGVQSVSALRSAGQAQDLLLQGNFGVGAHTVSVNFVNGFSGNMADADRALYINAITLDGNTTFENTSDRFAGAVNYSLTTPTTPTASKAGTQDTLVLNLSETQMGGADAQFMVSVDGQIVGGVHTVTAQHSASQTQDITLTGNFGSGSHAVTIDFLNGFAGNQADAGRTLYVNAITLDGKTTTENSTQSYVGAQTYAVQSGIVDTDTASNISASLDSLNANSQVSRVVVSDGLPVTLSASQWISDTNVISELYLPNGNMAPLKIVDTTSHFNGLTLPNTQVANVTLDLTDLVLAHVSATFQENAAGTAGALSVTDGQHSAVIELAASLEAAGFSGSAASAGFVFQADGLGGTIIHH